MDEWGLEILELKAWMVALGSKIGGCLTRSSSEELGGYMSKHVVGVTQGGSQYALCESLLLVSRDRVAHALIRKEVIFDTTKCT